MGCGWERLRLSLGGNVCWTNDAQQAGSLAVGAQAPSEAPSAECIPEAGLRLSITSFLR